MSQPVTMKEGGDREGANSPLKNRISPLKLIFLLTITMHALLNLKLICRRGANRTACGGCDSARNPCGCRGACRRGVGLCGVRENSSTPKEMEEKAGIWY